MEENQLRDLRRQLAIRQSGTRVGNLDYFVLERFVRIIERVEGKLRELCLEQSLGPVVKGSLTPDTTWNEYYGRNTPVEYRGPFTELRYDAGKFGVWRLSGRNEWSTIGVDIPYRGLKLLVLSDGSKISLVYVEPLIVNLRTLVDVDRYDVTTTKSGDVNIEIRIQMASVRGLA